MSAIKTIAGLRNELTAKEKQLEKLQAKSDKFASARRVLSGIYPVPQVTGFLHLSLQAL